MIKYNAEVSIMEIKNHTRKNVFINHWFLHDLSENIKSLLEYQTATLLWNLREINRFTADTYNASFLSCVWNFFRLMCELWNIEIFICNENHKK